jgi:hypothetical protein
MGDDTLDVPEADAIEGALAVEGATSGLACGAIAAFVEMNDNGTGTVQVGPAKLIADATIEPASAQVQTKCRVAAEACRIAAVIAHAAHNTALARIQDSTRAAITSANISSSFFACALDRGRETVQIRI